MNEFILAFKAHKKSTTYRVLREGFSSSDFNYKVDVIVLTILNILFISGLMGESIHELSGKISWCIWVLLCFVLMKRLFIVHRWRFSHLKLEFNEVIQFVDPSFSYPKLFLFIEQINDEGFNLNDVKKVKEMCDIELESMKSPQFLALQ
ncbi:TPA: hypothetical protein ACY4P8_004676 [Vibrio parahaemolyticus]